MSGRRQFGSSKSRKLAENAANGASKRTPRRKRVQLQANPPSARKPPEISLPTIDPSSSKLVLIRLPAHVDLDQLDSMRLDEPITLSDHRRYVFQLDDGADTTASAMLGDGTATPADGGNDNDEEEDEEVMDSRKRRNSKKTPSKQVKQTKTTPITPAPFTHRLRLVVDEAPRDLLQQSEEQFVTLRPAYPPCPQVGGLKRRWMPLGCTTPIAPTAAAMLTTTVQQHDDPVTAAKPSAQRKATKRKKDLPNGLPTNAIKAWTKEDPSSMSPDTADPSKTTAKKSKKRPTAAVSSQQEELTPPPPLRTKEDPSSTPTEVETETPPNGTKRRKRKGPPISPTADPGDNNHDDTMTVTSAFVKGETTSEENGRKNRSKIKTEEATGERSSKRVKKESSSKKAKKEEKKKERKKKKIKEESR